MKEWYRFVREASAGNFRATRGLVMTFLSRCLETLTTCDRQTAGFSVRGVFGRYRTDGRTSGHDTVAYVLSPRCSQRQ